MRHCDHDFICIKDANLSGDFGIVICIYCGQVRHTYPDGRVMVVVEEGQVKRNANSSPAQN